MIGDWDLDGLLDFLSFGTLKVNPYERLSASECREGSAKLREAIIPAQTFETDLGTPMEKMSSSVIMDASGVPHMEEVSRWLLMRRGHRLTFLRLAY